MKISFTPTKQSYYDYLITLVEGGMKVLGVGAFGVVFQHPTLKHVAVKVMSHEEGSFHWTQACIANQHNPHIPKLYSVHSFKAPFKWDDKHKDMQEDILWLNKIAPPTMYSGKYHVVFMEKLTALDGDEFTYAEGKKLMKTINKRAFNQKIRPLDVPEFADNIALMVETTGKQYDEFWRTLCTPKFFDAVMLVRRTSRKKDVRVDLHDGNVMLRRHPKAMPQIVITDPLAYGD